MTRRSGRVSRGFFGVAVYQPKTEVNVGTLWRSAYLNGAAFVATIGRRYRPQSSDTQRVPNHIPLIHYNDFDDLLAHLPYSCPIVGVEVDHRAKMLNEFSHPERCLYLLGAEDHGLPQRVIEECHYLVEIPTIEPQSMNVATAGAVAMYDRLSKRLSM